MGQTETLAAAATPPVETKPAPTIKPTKPAPMQKSALRSDDHITS